MANARGPWIGRLGLRLALAFVGVALAAVAASTLSRSVTAAIDFDRLINGQHDDVAGATAAALRSAYDHGGGWAHADLKPVVVLVGRVGASMRVTDAAGHVIERSRDFANVGTPQVESRQISADGHRVGTVELRFGDRGLGAAIASFKSERWPSRIGAAAIAAIIALVVALLVSRRITAPVDRLIDAARARGHGEFGNRVGAVTGFGEIRELARAFNEMADAMQEQDRVRRNLVADVAHELRTPIAVLQAGHEAMLDGLAEPASDHLASLRDEVLRLARMVDDLQRLASAEAAALQLALAPHDLATVAAAAAASMADSFAAAGINLRQRLAAVTVMCDPRRVREIVTNLLTNAMKFTPADGTVTLEAGPGDGDGELAVLRVGDTGVGIPADELPMVSERFFRGQRSLGIAGSGIGLTIVAELVRAHHGSLEITSEPGSGTQVTVRLPLADQPAGPDRAARRPVQAGLA